MLDDVIKNESKIGLRIKEYKQYSLYLRAEKKKPFTQTSAFEFVIENAEKLSEVGIRFRVFIDFVHNEKLFKGWVNIHKTSPTTLKLRAIEDSAVSNTGFGIQEVFIQIPEF
jgi:hypothetical protein